jgi:hypothetical protein
MCRRACGCRAADVDLAFSRSTVAYAWYRTPTEGTAAEEAFRWQQVDVAAHFLAHLPLDPFSHERAAQALQLTVGKASDRPLFLDVGPLCQASAMHRSRRCRRRFCFHREVWRSWRWLAGLRRCR